SHRAPSPSSDAAIAAALAATEAKKRPPAQTARGLRPRAAFHCNLDLALSVKRQRRFFIIAASHAGIGEHAVGGNPLERLLVDFFGIRLEYQPLAGSPAPRIHHCMEAIGELVLVIMGVKLRPQVDIALRPAQRPEEFA